ncbi:MAG TPA: hypothetical protein VKB05_17650 [Pyrinomonadaceae bacterium]|nr:hypothetical protein [Pyrinomonadaceae bacterium]
MKTLLLLALTAVITGSGLLASTVATTATIPPVSTASVMPKAQRRFQFPFALLRFFAPLRETV